MRKLVGRNEDKWGSQGKRGAKDERERQRKKKKTKRRTDGHTLINSRD